ncbi:sensor histidine kinase [Pseudanabaena sp. UWO310]|uniref:sensor histidine kinase n=1 Tax=Pseudanabaena sp. UWO310 TaxID=2480795 RepID=UPI001CC1D815|nr:HAMP domain-containing sensor histidine kinase [Pseudanabaena sp. UWO310]
MILKYLKNLHFDISQSIIGLFGIVIVLEFLTPSDYVFGYLYTAPILLINNRFGRIATFQATALACFLTMLNIWIPSYESRVSTISSRLIACLSLIMTGFLCDRNRSFQQTLLQQQEKLLAQEKLASVREDFTSTLTHDLKTPLLGAIETLKALQRSDFGPILPTQKNAIATMIRSHQNSLQMIETLLDVYRNDTEGIKLHRAPIDLVSNSEEVTSTLMELAASRRIHISFHYGDSDFRQFLWVDGDALQLHRVFANLLTNTINHSPRGSKVEVVFEAGSTHHVCKVLDTGPGITLTELPYLFDRFYQGNSDRQAKGSGLGLYLTRQIIEAHGGSVWAENRHPNGAIFGFRLPISSL